MKICKICGCEIEDDDIGFGEAAVVNKGMESEHVLCSCCLGAERDAGRVIQCDACGENFTADALHDEEINGQSFTPCPACGKDVVDCLTREEFEADSRPVRYAVIVRDYQGRQRGYVVSVNIGAGQNEVIRKLAEKVDLNTAAAITVGIILLKEDEF